MSKNPKIIAIDFDKTLCEYDVSKYPRYVTKQRIVDYGKPIKKNIDFLVQLKKKYKCKLIIYSSRWWGDYKVVEEWLDNIKFPYDDIILGKFKADVHFDDRAINATHYNKKDMIALLID